MVILGFSTALGALLAPCRGHPTGWGVRQSDRVAVVLRLVWRIESAGVTRVLFGAPTNSGSFFLVEDGAAGFANGYAMLDSLRADRALGERLGIVDPRFFQIELARRAAFEVGDEHGIARAFPLEIGRGDEAALKFFQTPARTGKFTFGGRFTSGDKYAADTSLPRIVVEFARDVFGDFPGGDVVLHEVSVAHVHYALATANRRNRKGFAVLRRNDLQRTEVRAMARGPFLHRNVDERAQFRNRAGVS